MSDNDQSFSQDKQDTLFGTNIAMEKTNKKLSHFILNFKLEDTDMDIEGNQYYLQRLDLLKQSNGVMLMIDGEHIYQYDKELYQQMIRFPSDIIMIFDRVVSEIFASLFQNEVAWNTEVAIYNLRKHIRVRELNPKVLLIFNYYL
jgi:DNA replication licensing factor MCM4